MNVPAALSSTTTLNWRYCQCQWRRLGRGPGPRAGPCHWRRAWCRSPTRSAAAARGACPMIPSRSHWRCPRPALEAFPRNSESESAGPGATPSRRRRSGQVPCRRRTHRINAAAALSLAASVRAQQDRVEPDSDSGRCASRRRAARASAAANLGLTCSECGCVRMSLRGQPGPVPGADVAGASPLAGNVAAALPWVPREYPESTLDRCAPQGTGTHPPSHSPSPGYPEYLLSAERRKRPARIRLRTHPLSHAPSSLRSRQRTSPAVNVVVAFVAVVESVTRAAAAAVRAIGAPE